MTTIWFTSDTHFGHDKIIDYCDRPFNSAEEMDEYMADNWNSVVMPGDLVYHLGDVQVGTRRDIPGLFSRLNGSVFLIKGNHDHKKSLTDILWINGPLRTYCKDSPSFWMSHYPPDSTNNKYRRKGDILLAGHVHSKEPLQNNDGYTWIDVGVDAWDFFPVNYIQIVKLWYGVDVWESMEL